MSESKRKRSEERERVGVGEILTSLIQQPMFACCGFGEAEGRLWGKMQWKPKGSALCTSRRLAPVGDLRQAKSLLACFARHKLSLLRISGRPPKCDTTPSSSSSSYAAPRVFRLISSSAHPPPFTASPPAWSFSCHTSIVSDPCSFPPYGSGDGY